MKFRAVSDAGGNADTRRVIAFVLNAEEFSGFLTNRTLGLFVV